MKFTQNQLMAIETIGKNLIVSAGAGSGKTQVLNEKVYYLMKKYGYHLKDMLILTFTNFAAAEMKQRIRKRIANEFPTEAIEIDTANICTFDSYALNLVKKYHILLGLDENISLVQSNVMNVKCHEWTEELFHELYEKEDKDFLYLIDYLCFKNDQDVINYICDLVHEQNQNEHDYLAPLDQKEYEQMIDDLIAKKEQELNELKDDLYGTFLLVEHEKWQEKINERFASVFSAKTFNDFVYLKENYPSLAGTSSLKGFDDAELKEKRQAFSTLSSELKEKIENLSLKEEIVDCFKEKYKCIQILQKLAKIIYDKQASFKRERQCFEFSDIAYFAYQLIKEHDDIREEIASSLKIIMVDEYQDTSYAQERFLLEIARDNLFMVGDIKQSIYRFRNAKPEIFKEKYEKYSQNLGGIKIDLNHNFRSRKEVLNDINTIFSQIMTLDIGDADYQKDHVIIPGNENYDKLKIIPPETTFISYDPELYEINKNELEAKFIASDILKRIEAKQKIMVLKKENGVEKFTEKEVDYSSFCILMDRTTDFYVYQNVFKDMGIPLIVTKDENIFDNDLPKVFKNILTLLNELNENEDLSIHALTSIARSFLYDYSDKEINQMIQSNTLESSKIVQDLKDILDSRSNETLEELIDLVYQKLDVFNKLVHIGDIRINSEYLFAFKNAVLDMDQLNFTLDEAILFFDHLSQFDEKYKNKTPSVEGNAVKLMNIHQSKGLEFPIVYYSGLYKEFNKTEIKSSFQLSPKYGMILPNKNGEKSLLHEEYAKDIEREALSERIRIFYVALTRAREQMIFLMPFKKNIVVDVEDAKTNYDLLTSSGFIGEEIMGTIDNSSRNNLKNRKEDLTYEEIRIPRVEKEIRKASKNVSLESNRDALLYGEQVHFLMQMVDFSSDDVSFIDLPYLRKVISRFLSSSLADEIRKGKIYQEYEFEDVSSRGVIDLFSLRDDDIILVDYKLKNIADEEYNKQLKTYALYLEKVFHKKVKAYLYALLTGEVSNIF